MQQSIRYCSPYKTLGLLLTIQHVVISVRMYAAAAIVFSVIVSTLFCTVQSQPTITWRHAGNIFQADSVAELAAFNSSLSSPALSRRADNGAWAGIGAYWPPATPIYIPPSVQNPQPEDEENTAVIGISDHEKAQTRYVDDISINGVIGHGVAFFYGLERGQNTEFVIGTKFPIDNQLFFLDIAREAARLGRVYYYIVFLPNTSQDLGQQISLWLLALLPSASQNDILYYHRDVIAAGSAYLLMYSFVANRGTNCIMGYSTVRPINAQLLMDLNPRIL